MTGRNPMTRLTLNLAEAADLLKVSPDALMRKTRAGTVLRLGTKNHLLLVTDSAGSAQVRNT